MLTFCLYGRMPSAAFQQCCEAAAFVDRTARDRVRVDVCYEVPRDYVQRREQLLQQQHRRQQQQRQQQQRQQQQRQQGAMASADDHDDDACATWQCSDALAVDADGRVYTHTRFLALLQRETTYRVVPQRRPCTLCNNNNNDNNNTDEHNNDDHADAAAVTASYAHAALHTWRRFLHARGNSYAWLTVTIDGRDAGCIVVELYSAQLPRTCNNFLRLCRGDCGTICVPATHGGDAYDADAAIDNNNSNNNNNDNNACSSKVTLCYKGTTFFRTVRDAYVMAGDVSDDHGGNGGYSCYGRYFPDESFDVAHDAAGVVGMCNDGPHTNASCFYITQRALPWMNGRYVAFGRVIDGMHVVAAIHGVPTRHNQTPTQRIVISDCGELDVSM